MFIKLYLTILNGKVFECVVEFECMMARELYPKLDILGISPAIITILDY